MEFVVGDTQAGWYDDGSGTKRWFDGENWTEAVQPAATAPSVPGRDSARLGAGPASGGRTRPVPHGANYVVLQVILKEKLWGTGSGNLTELEDVINKQAVFGYRLHTITTASSGSKGAGGGDRVQATMVFERV
jgi:Protein of unknown function (DUF2510)